MSDPQQTIDDLSSENASLKKQVAKLTDHVNFFLKNSYILMNFMEISQKH